MLDSTSAIDTLKKISTWTQTRPFSPCVVQVFPASKIGGLAHVGFAGAGMALALNANSMAFRRPELEWLGRVAGERHLEKAQSRVGWSSKEKECVVGFLLPSSARMNSILSSFSKDIHFTPGLVSFGAGLSLPSFPLSPEDYFIERAALSGLRE